MSVRKICILGLSVNWIPLSAVISLKCPEIRVCVVQKNPDLVYFMNTGQIPPELSLPGIEEFIRSTHNKNLFFTTNEKHAIKDAEIIFIMSSSKLKVLGNGKKEAVDLSMIEEAASLIAENAETDKIIVESSSIPMRTTECVRNILKRNGAPMIHFEVISNPEFYEQGNVLRNLLNPDCVMIGCENTPKGLAAARLLASLYERWIPSKSIIIRNTWSIELSKICIDAMMAQMVASIQSIAVICEEVGADVSICKDSIGKSKDIGSGIFDTCFNVRKLPLAVRNLVYLYESCNFPEEANYWRVVLEMFSFNKTRFFKNLISNLNGTVTERRITLMGFAYFIDTEVTEGSSAVDLCSWLLEENAFVNVYHSRMAKEHVTNAVMLSGCKKPVEDIERLLLVFDDPYKATKESQVIIVCCPWPEIGDLDFKAIYKHMKKPAYIYDTGSSVPHDELFDIGFKVYAHGKFILKPF